MMGKGTHMYSRYVYTVKTTYSSAVSLHQILFPLTSLAGTQTCSHCRARQGRWGRGLAQAAPLLPPQPGPPGSWPGVAVEARGKEQTQIKCTIQPTTGLLYGNNHWIVHHTSCTSFSLTLGYSVLITHLPTRACCAYLWWVPGEARFHSVLEQVQVLHS